MITAEVSAGQSRHPRGQRLCCFCKKASARTGRCFPKKQRTEQGLKKCASTCQKRQSAFLSQASLNPPAFRSANGKLLDVGQKHVALLVGEHVRHFLPALPCEEGQQKFFRSCHSTILLYRVYLPFCSRKGFREQKLDLLKTAT